MISESADSFCDTTDCTAKTFAASSNCPRTGCLCRRLGGNSRPQNGAAVRPRHRPRRAAHPPRHPARVCWMSSSHICTNGSMPGAPMRHASPGKSLDSGIAAATRPSATCSPSGRRTSSYPHLRSASIRQATGWLTRHPARLTDDDRSQLDALLDRSPALVSTHRLAHDFAEIITERRGSDLAARMTAGDADGKPALRSFVRVLRRDLDAVTAVMIPTKSVHVSHGMLWRPPGRRLRRGFAGPRSQPCRRLARLSGTCWR